MTKSDLKTGHIVEFRNGQLGLIAKDNCYGQDAIIESERSWTQLKDFNENMIWCFQHEMGFLAKRGSLGGSVDIMKVYKPSLPTGFLSRGKSSGYNDKLELIWERNDKKEMTVSEIEKELGYSIKIVKG